MAPSAWCTRLASSTARRWWLLRKFSKTRDLRYERARRAPLSEGKKNHLFPLWLELNVPHCLKSRTCASLRLCGVLFFNLFLCAFLPLQNRELQIMRKLDHCNIVRLRYFFYSSGEKVCTCVYTTDLAFWAVRTRVSRWSTLPPHPAFLISACIDDDSLA